MVWKEIGVFVISYLIGSFPTAYLLVKWRTGIDVRHAGSGNVGTLNALRITHSKWLSFIVLIVDLAKGMLAILLSWRLFGAAESIQGLAAIGAVLGHNFPVWLRFHGGRGLAVAGGVLLLIAPKLMALWFVLWGIGYLIFRKVIYASMLALGLAFVFIWWPENLFCRHAQAWYLTLVAGVVLIKHLPRFFDAVKGRRLESME